MATPLKVFCCYAREDQEMLAHLKRHLAPLVRRGQITIWSDTDLGAGVEWEKELHKHLEQADIILLLISSYFMASDYCYSTEMRWAIERHEQDSARVVPIILSATYWHDAPFATLQILPKAARPVKSWPDQDEAFHEVAEQLAKMVTVRRKEIYLSVGEKHFTSRRYEEALVAYEQTFLLDPASAAALVGKSRSLNGLNRYEEALGVCEQILFLDSLNAWAYHGKGAALIGLERSEEALVACEQAIRFDPTLAEAYSNKGAALHRLRRYEEALIAFKQAIRFDPTSAVSYYGKGVALCILNRYEEALAACEQAIRLDPTFALAYHVKGVVLEYFKRYSEALMAFELALRFDPTYAQTYYSKGIVLGILGWQREADQSYARARELGYPG